MAKKREKAKTEGDAVLSKKTGVPGTPFPPGKSGNPGGRPKKFITILSDAVREKLKDKTPDETQTYAEALADKLVNEALRGKMPIIAIREIADRAEGKPVQAVKLDGKLDTGQDRAKRLEELVARLTSESK